MTGLLLFVFLYVIVNISSPQKYIETNMLSPYDRKWRRTKEPLDESERGEWKSWLKAQHSEN